MLKAEKNDLKYEKNNFLVNISLIALIIYFIIYRVVGFFYGFVGRRIIFLSALLPTNIIMIISLDFKVNLKNLSKYEQ